MPPLSPRQSWLYRYLAAVDPPPAGARPQQFPGGPQSAAGLLKVIEGMQALAAEGAVRGFDVAVDADDLAAIGSAMTLAQYTTLRSQLAALNATLHDQNSAIMSAMFAVRS